MSLLRLVLPALAAAGTAYAACSNSATATIQNSGDASALSTCNTFSGSIAIATGTTDDIALDGVRQIKGNLVAASNSGVKRISGSALESITGTLEINDVSQLASLDFPQLTEVDEVTLKGLPSLRELGFAAEVSKCSTLDVENTNLQDLKGLNLQEADSILIANNPQIKEISMQLTNVSNLILSYNNADVKVSFANLSSANSTTFRACGSVDVSSLETLKSTLSILEGNLESFAAPNLTKIEGALAIVGNKNLKNISFPEVSEVSGNLQIANNTNLEEIAGFPKLEQVLGALDMSGNFTKVETPSLNYVKGVFNLQSTGDIQSACDGFYDPLRDEGKLPKTKYQCKGKLSDPGTAGTTPTGGSKPTGAASPLNVQNTYMGLAGLAAVFLL